MSKTDTAFAVAIVGLAALGGYGIYKKFIADTPPATTAGANERGEWEQSAQTGTGGLFQSSYNLGYETGGAIGDILNALFGRGTAIPEITTKVFDPIHITEDMQELNRHIQLLGEYLIRHPAAVPDDYYAEYPETAWIKPYAQPYFSTIQATADAAQPEVQLMSAPAPIISTAPATDSRGYADFTGGYTGGTTSGLTPEQAASEGWTRTWL